MTFITYNTTNAVTYTPGQSVKRINNCNGFIAVNTGDTIVFVNDQILYPGVPGTSIGDSMTVGGNFGEIYLGVINVRFGPVAADPQVMITQKFYLIEGKPII